MRSTLAVVILAVAIPGQQAEFVFDVDKTRVVRSSGPRPDEADAQRFLAAGGLVYYVAQDAATGTELYRTDGTQAGTILLKDIRKGRASSRVSELTAVGSYVYFRADDGVHGEELWRTDGTPAGTILVADVWRGLASSKPTDLAPLLDRVVFAANDGVHGRELWISDGTRHGTRLLHDIKRGALGSNPYGMTFVKGRTSYVYFAADDGTHGVEPWLTSGVATSLLEDVHRRGSSNARNFVAVGSRVVFEAENGANGFELWSSDGTTRGTIFVRDIQVGAGSGTQLGTHFVDAGYVYFVGRPTDKLREVWRTDAARSDVPRE